MLFFGWGRNNKTHEIGPGQTLVVSYGYFHLFFLFRVVFDKKYSLATLTEHGWAARPLPTDAVLPEHADAVAVHWWWRFGLVIALAAVVVLVVMTSLFNA